jgi:D-ribulokinase
MNEVVIGIDLGTQGVRILAVDQAGNVLAAAHQPLPLAERDLPPGWFEQAPENWWQCTRDALRKLISNLPSTAGISGICIDSTSGTVLPIDANGYPLHPALMYNDRRSEGQVAAVQAAGSAHQKKLGYQFGSSYALPKILWFKQERPDVFARAHRFVHAADWLAGCLTGDFSVSDTSNALKTGYDLIDLCWPAFIEQDLHIPLERLPRVVLPGAQMGQVSPSAAAETGLAPGIPVFAGVTDGTAAQIASGAARPGEWNSTLGTTLVLKGIARTMALDPQGRVYFHRHPEGWWMPGGASNTGSEWMLQDHPGEDPAALDRQAAVLLPTRLVRYPLAKRGERFPFISSDAVGFMLGEPSDPVERYAAGLEGVALLERLTYATLAGLGLEVGESVFITGGGSHSLVWSQVRASVLGKTLVQPVVTDTAFGAAIIAASGCWFGSISQAARGMVRIARTIQPEPSWVSTYAERYATFVQELHRRGYIEENG